MLAIAVTSTTPTAELIFVAVTISLMIPCLAGEKIAHCTPSRNKPKIASERVWDQSATKIIPMMATCAQSVVTITFRFEKRSETQPAMGANRTNGRMMMAARMVLICLAAISAYSGWCGNSLAGTNSDATAAPSAMSMSLAALSFSRT